MTAKPYIPPAAKISNRASKPLRQGTKARKEYKRKTIDCGPRWVPEPYQVMPDEWYDAIPWEVIFALGVM